MSRVQRTLLYGLGLVLVGVTILIVVRRENAAPTVASTAQQTLDTDEVAPAVCPGGTGGRITCLLVSVPEDHADPEFSSIDAFVARVSPALPTDATPLAFIGDGLGSAAASDFGDWQRIARTLQREIVLIDLRGSGMSEPRLVCPEMSRTTWLERELSGESLEDGQVELRRALGECAERLAPTLDLTDHTLDAMIADLDVVRERLAVDRWTLAAGGETSIVARHAAERFPETVDGLVLIGVEAGVDDRHVARYEYAQEVLDELLDPTVAATLERATAPLKNRLIAFPVTSRGRRVRVAVSNGTVAPTMVREASEPEFRDGVAPFVLGRLAEGQWRVLAQLRAQQDNALAGRSVAAATIVLCADQRWLEAPQLTDAVDDFDDRWIGLLDDVTLDPGLCDADGEASIDELGSPGAPPQVGWVPVAPLDPPSAPTVPTLVINGVFDVTAPRSAAVEVAEAWPDATVEVLEDAGHPSLTDECTMEIVAKFLSVPTDNVDAAC